MCDFITKKYQLFIGQYTDFKGCSESIRTSGGALQGNISFSSVLDDIQKTRQVGMIQCSFLEISVNAVFISINACGKYILKLFI